MIEQTIREREREREQTLKKRRYETIWTTAWVAGQVRLSLKRKADITPLLLIQKQFQVKDVWQIISQELCFWKKVKRLYETYD